MRNKKILVVSNLYYPYIIGGAEIVCQNLSEGLSALGYDITILTTNNGRFTSCESVNGLKVIRLKNCNFYFQKQEERPSWLMRRLWHILDIYNPFVKKEVARIVNRIKPDIVICHNLAGFSISILDCLNSFDIPIIEVLHDQYFLCPKSISFKDGKICETQCLECRLMRLPHRKKSSVVDVVVGVSKFVLKRLVDRGYFKNSQQYVIHNAQNINVFPKREAWSGQRTLKVGYIGGLAEAKGVSLLINAFMSLTINAELLIAGVGNKEYEMFLKTLASEDKRIKFLGYMKPVDFYCQIDVCVLPSICADTFPGVAYESCAYGIPVIASRIGGIPEIIKNNRNGLLVESGSAEDLKAAISELYNYPEKLLELSKNARSEVEEMIDEKNWILKYDVLIQKVLQRK